MRLNLRQNLYLSGCVLICAAGVELIYSFSARSEEGFVALSAGLVLIGLGLILTRWAPRE